MESTAEREFRLPRRDGDDRFEREVLRHLDAGHNLARWLLRDGPDAEDALQCAAIKAHERFSTMRGDSPKPWFLAIVRNECLNLMRKRSSMRNLEWNLDEEWDAPQPDASGPEEALLKTVEHGNVQAAIDSLPPAHREVVLLREIEDMSYSQIATITGVPIGTVMSRLARARQSLRASLQTWEDSV